MAETEKLWHEKEEFGWAARLSNWILRHSGPFARVPPNLVTLAGAALIAPMLIAFMSGAMAFGAFCFSLSLTTDWLDGALSRHQMREHAAGRLDLRHDRSDWLKLGPTEFGKKFDPVVDKLRYFPALLSLGWNLMPHWLIALAIAFALCLTFFREVVRWIWGLKPGANSVGKIKVYVEAGVIVCLIFRGAWPPSGLAALALFVAATSLGGASLFTQGQSIRRQVKTFNDKLSLENLPWQAQARVIREELENRK